MSYMYDDPPDDKYYVNPDYRPKKTYYLKLDHPTQSYKNPGHWQNPHKHEYANAAKAGDSEMWEPSQSKGRPARSGII